MVGGRRDTLWGYSEAPDDWYNRVLGFDRAGKLYRFMMIERKDDDAQWLYVHVLDPRSGLSSLVDLGRNQDIVGSLSRVTVDSQGNIYQIMTTFDTMEIVKYTPGPG
jgi:hypothetical protein